MVVKTGKEISNMEIADRIQYLRKKKGMSQEELAEKIGVSRQAVSKWESRQSLPDIEKIILLSNYFQVTTDYLLKGIEKPFQTSEINIQKTARIFYSVASALNFIGLVVSVFLWIEYQNQISVAVGLCVTAMGCMLFAIGQFYVTNKKLSFYSFWAINVWFVSLLPVSCVFNSIQGIFEGYMWVFAPIPQLGNSFIVYGIGWLLYIFFCVVIDISIWILKRKE